MRFGISSHAYPWAIGVPGYTPPNPMDAFRLLDKVVGFDLTLVQFAGNLPLTDLTERERAGLAERAFSAGIHIEVGTAGIDAANLDAYVEIAEVLRTPFLRLALPQENGALLVPEIIECLRSPMEHLRRAGIKLALEYSEGVSIQDLIRIASAFELGTVGTCLVLNSPTDIIDIPDLILAHTVSIQLQETPAFPVPSEAVPFLRQRFPRCQSVTLGTVTRLQSDITDTISLEARLVAERVRFWKSVFPSA